MTARKQLGVYVIITLVVSVPCAILHVMAAPDEAAITPLQRLAAVLANYFGPWGVALVHLVEFPNAGLRSFSWPLAIGLTLLGGLLLLLPMRVRIRPWQFVLTVLWAIFALVWFGVGLCQIADGLL
jgi:hypothetical protein